MTLHIDYKLPLFVSVYIKHFHAHKNIYLSYMYADAKKPSHMVVYIYGHMKKHSIYLAQINILFMYFGDAAVTKRVPMGSGSFKYMFGCSITTYSSHTPF